MIGDCLPCNPQKFLPVFRRQHAHHCSNLASFAASSRVCRMCFQWLPTQYTFSQLWLLHFQNWSYVLRLSSGTSSAMSLFDFSIRLAPHSGHLEIGRASCRERV